MRIMFFKRLSVLPGLLLLFIVLGAFAQGGVPLWTNQFGGSYGGYDQSNALICDSSGNVIVTGYIQTGNSLDLMAAVKYSGPGCLCGPTSTMAPAW